MTATLQNLSKSKSVVNVRKEYRTQHEGKQPIDMFPNPIFIFWWFLIDLGIDADDHHIDKGYIQVLYSNDIISKNLITFIQHPQENKNAYTFVTYKI